jgi:hypothetical protein
MPEAEEAVIPIAYGMTAAASSLFYFLPEPGSVSLA